MPRVRVLLGGVVGLGVSEGVAGRCGLGFQPGVCEEEVGGLS